VAIDRRRGTAAEQLLYSPIVISEVASYPAPEVEGGPNAGRVHEPARFTATAWGLSDADAAALREVSALGGRLSSGLGRVAIDVLPEPTAASAPWRLPLAERLRHFNAIFAARWRLLAEHCAPAAAPGWSPEAWRVFSVTVQREAVLLEADWQPAIVFSAAQLHAQTGLEARLLRSQAGAQVIGGWSARWNRQRPTVLATAAGSVYMFCTQAGEPEIVAALAKLEEQGIGARRSEGYGIVRGCDEFHIQATGAAI
jgi:CRISPR-associated protein Csx10